MSSGYVADMATMPAPAPASNRSTGVSWGLPVVSNWWSEINLQHVGTHKAKRQHQITEASTMVGLT
jgi:hypothetical protein